MHKMRYRKEVISSALLSALVLTACGDNSTSANATENSSSSGTISSSSTITVVPSGTVVNLTAEELAKGGTWNAEGTTYIVDDCSETVTGNAIFGPKVFVKFKSSCYVSGSLSFQEGTTAYVDANVALIFDGGKLTSKGSDSLPVQFKPLTAGKYWGATLGHGDDDAYGFGIYLESDANATSSISYTNFDSSLSALYIAVDGVDINNSTFSNNKGYGIFFETNGDAVGPKKGFSKNSFNKNGYPICLGAAKLGRLDGSQIFTNEKSIKLTGYSTANAVTESAVWPNLSVPYLLTESVYLENAAGMTVEIAAGTHFLFEEDVTIGVGAGSALKVSGTKANPVVINHATSGKYVGDLTDGSENVIHVEYNASANTAFNALQIDSAGVALKIDRSGIKIDSCTFSNSKKYAVYFDANIAPASFKGNTFKSSSETQYAFSIGFGSLTALDNTSTFTGDNNDILVRGIDAQDNYATASGTIVALPVSYVIANPVLIENETKEVSIIVAAGTKFRMIQGTHIRIGKNGSLGTQGTSASPVVFVNAVSGTSWGDEYACDSNGGGIIIEDEATTKTTLVGSIFYGVYNDAAVCNESSTTFTLDYSVKPGI